MATDRAPHNMTTNTAPTPYVASASSEYGGVYKAYRAFNGYASGEDVWITQTGSSGWVQIDMGSGNAWRIGTYAVQGGATPNRSPSAWVLQGSNDATNWTTLDTVTGQSSWGSGEKRTFTCDAIAGPFRYFRFTASANNGDALLAVGELFLYDATTAPGAIAFRVLQGANA